MENKTAAYYRAKIDPKLASLSPTSMDKIRIGTLMSAVEELEPPDIEEDGPEPKPGDESIDDIAASIQMENLPTELDGEGLSLHGLVKDLIEYGRELEDQL